MDGQRRVYSKTAKGEEELHSRKHGLPLQERRVLILVDGVSDVQRILEKGEGLPDIEESLERLEREGYISAGAESVSPDIKSELIEMARRVLGPNAGRIVKKIENSEGSREALKATLEECKKLVKLTIDEGKAEQLAEECTRIIETL